MPNLIFNRFYLLLLTTTLVFASCEVNDETSVSTKEQMVDVGGYKLYTRTGGDKTPTVVLITGFAGTTNDWKIMEDDIAEMATVINYDREGLGRSDSKNRPKDSETIARELHALLRAKGLNTPYVLAAHSLGGIHARVFTNLYKDEVAGLLLVDPTPENLIDSLLAALPPDLQADIREQLRQQEEDALSQLPEGAIKEEFRAVNTSYEQARGLAFTTDAPVAIISSLKLEQGDTQESKDMAKRLRDELLDNLCTGPNKHYTTSTAGHFIQKDQPGLVMEALGWVLENIQ